MFKFLRKYNKYILAVGGTLLMIVFLVPQAIQSLSQRAAVGSAVWATVGADNKEVSARDRRTCEVELDILERLGRAGVRLGITDEPEHWYLLVREADQAGLVGGRAGDQLSPELLGSLASVVGPTPALDQAITKSLAVGRLLDLYQRAGKLSDGRIRAEAERLFHSVEGRAVVLEAAAGDDAPEPSEAEIVAQFDKYRDVNPGGSAANPVEDPEAEADAEAIAKEMDAANPAGFGYRLPDRFKLEWLRIERDDVRAMIEAGDELNNIELIKHWKRNQEAKAFPPVDATAEVPDRVRADLLNELTTRKLDAIRKFASDRFLASWRRLPSPEGYYELPDDWIERRVGFGELALAMQAEFEDLALPAYEAVGDRWLVIEDIDGIEDLSGAGTDKYARGVTDVATLVDAAKEFGGSPTMLVQEGVAGPVLSDAADQSLVLFRIIETDASRPAKDLAEVRDRVVADLQRKMAYDKLVSEIGAIEQAALNDGLLALAVDRDTDVQRLSGVSLYNPGIAQFQLQNNMALRALPSALPVVGQDEAATEAIVDRALALPRDTPTDDVPRAERLLVLSVDRAMAVLVVEIEGQTPLDRERFGTFVGSRALQTMMLGQELVDVNESLADVFSYEVMKKRHNFNVMVRETEDDAGDEGDPTEQTANAG